MIEPMYLTNLEEALPGPGRIVRRFPTFGGVFFVLRELVASLPRDILRAVRPGRNALLRTEDGVSENDEMKRIALYVHYSAIGQVSDMVLCQIDWLRECGFSVVFISMSHHLDEVCWQEALRRCVLVVHRDNFGLDFGAWRDILPEIRRRWPIPHELMLVNDSVLGPIHPLAPVIDVIRAGGEGLFGLTESLQGGPHLQSYMLLACGQSAVEDLMRFFRKLYVTHSKSLLIRRGEIKLSRWMRQRGHRVAAVFGYDRLLRVALADQDERKRLLTSIDGLSDPEDVSTAEAISILHHRPVNPTHMLWRVLATRFNGPFLKTELVARNPKGLLDVADWPKVVSADSPCSLLILLAHVEMVNRRRTLG